MKEKKSNEEKRKIKIKIICVWGILVVLLWATGIIFSGKNSIIGDRLLLIESALIFIPFVLGIIVSIFKRIKSLLTSNKITNMLLGIITIATIITIAIGVTIKVLGSPSEKYSIQKVNVIGVSNGKIIVDGSNFYHGDAKQIEVNKPLFAQVKSGDIITVRCPDNPEEMYYVLEEKVGDNVFIVGLFFIGALMIIEIILFIFVDCNPKNRRVRN